MLRVLLMRKLAMAATFSVSVCTSLAQSTVIGDTYAQAETLIREHQWDAGLALLHAAPDLTPQTPKMLNLAGLAYIGKGDAEHAAQYFESALKLKPDFLPALKNLAIDEVSMGKVDEAQQHLQAASKQSPDDPVINLYLGEIAYERQDFSAAAIHLQRAQSLVSRDPNLVASLAISELKSGKRTQALHTLDALHPTVLNPHSQLLLGLALAKQDLGEQAIPYLEGARSASPGSPEISFDLALCYLTVKEYSLAIHALQAIVDEQHETSEVDNVLAEAYEGDHNTPAAVGALRRAIALSPEDEDNYLDFASLCMDHAAFEDAAKVLAVGLAAHPKSSRLIFERGILDAMQDRFEQAESDFQLSTDLAPKTDAGYIGLGVTYLETGKSAQAVPLLRSRLHDHPNDASLNFLLGEALLRSGALLGQPAYTEAQTHLHKAVELDPTLVEPHVSLGTIYLQEEKFQLAVDELEAARRLDWRSKAAYSHLAVAYRRLGKLKEAKEVLLQLKTMNDQERTGAKDSVRSSSADVASPPEPSRLTQ